MRSISLMFSYFDKFFEYVLKNIVTGKFKTRAEYIGTFVLFCIGLGGGLIAFSLFFGINPTLVMSVVAAPIWVGLVFLCNRITKIAITLKDIPEPDIKTTKSRRK